MKLTDSLDRKFRAASEKKNGYTVLVTVMLKSIKAMYILKYTPEKRQK